METTFDLFINNNPVEKQLFEKEYTDFLASERVREKREKARLSADTKSPNLKDEGISRGLARMRG